MRSPPKRRRCIRSLSFRARGIALKSLSTAGYDEAIERVVPAAQSLKAQGAQAIMVIGTSLTFYRGAAFNQASDREPVRGNRPACIDHERRTGRRAGRGRRAPRCGGHGLFGRRQRNAGRVPARMRLRCPCAPQRQRRQACGRGARRPPRTIFCARASRPSKRRATPTAMLIVCGGLRTLDVAPLSRRAAACRWSRACRRRCARRRSLPAPAPHASGRLWPSAQRHDSAGTFPSEKPEHEENDHERRCLSRGLRRGRAARQRVRARLSLAHRHRCRADRGRRRRRHHRAHFRRAASGQARSAVRGGKPHRRRRHHRHQLCREGAARRLHAAADGKLRAARQVDLQDAAVRPAEGLHADRARRFQSAGAVRQSVVSREGHEGTRRAREGQSRQGFRRACRACRISSRRAC